MAFLDFNTVIGDSTGAFVGGDDGSQQINAALPNPLLLQGADCRSFVPAPNVTGDQFRHVRFMVDATAHPSFTSIPDTQAISVRAWVRKELENGVNNNNAQQCIYLHVKGDAIFGLNGNNGYTLAYGLDTSSAIATGSYGTLNLRLRSELAGVQFDVPNIVDLPRDTWHQIRLDVIPTKNGAVVDRDTIRVYTSSLADEANPVWVLQHEEVVLLSQAYAAVWGATTTRVGFGACMVSGIFASYNKATYIDGFDVRVANV